MKCDLNNKNECYPMNLSGVKPCPACVGGNLIFCPDILAKEPVEIKVHSMCNYEEFECDCGKSIYSIEKYLTEVDDNPKYVCKECYLRHKKMIEVNR